MAFGCITHQAEIDWVGECMALGSRLQVAGDECWQLCLTLMPSMRQAGSLGL